ncbi:GlsB/YeaQ/YmgE family stress response membrane protein [Leucobacter luti]|uniref:Putative membrane protein YeaQ/YmgE (Transglycosylase-associated protein family) n=1 Tax=Leucobacter luti TaxID=340320 RepID=A0A4Q7U675_9MICO|nr:GlsB/YeaQ/YmgE family stress response membrane protein [Leucobacter luti]MBL3700926.1 GlsB/YeaQ/YmgE family stress response membrane protein [Leucobacter luti]RZT68853.1 putative membrane protein YeaQ/YmgE (transglycosylase-associated protein family) [Leucobacter luti]
MSFIAFLILGLIAGAIAKAIMPGENGGGWFTTLLLGVIGAMLGGWLGGMIFGADMAAFWSLSTWLLAIGGSIIVLLIFGLFSGNRRSSAH